MPSISQSLASSNGVSVQEQHFPETISSGVQGAAQDAKKGLCQSPVMQELCQCWQALADVICQAGVKAVEAGITEAPVGAESNNHLAFANPESTPALESWSSLHLLLESRAWWWDKAVFDASAQACCLATGHRGSDAACAMTVVSDFMLREQTKLVGSASLLKTISRPSQDPTNSPVGSAWAQRTLKLAAALLPKLR